MSNSEVTGLLAVRGEETRFASVQLKPWLEMDFAGDGTSADWPRVPGKLAGIVCGGRTCPGLRIVWRTRAGRAGLLKLAAGTAGSATSLSKDRVLPKSDVDWTGNRTSLALRGGAWWIPERRGAMQLRPTSGADPSRGDDLMRGQARDIRLSDEGAAAAS